MNYKQDRSFALLWGGVLVAISLWPLHQGRAAKLPLLALAFVVLAIAAVQPGFVAPLRRVWMILGRLLHRAATPVVVAATFFLVLTPFALLFRMLRRDALRLRPDPSAESYWVVREQQPGAMTEQF